MKAYTCVYQETIGKHTRQIDVIVMHPEGKDAAVKSVQDTVDGEFKLIAINLINYEDIFYLSSREI